MVGNLIPFFGVAAVLIGFAAIEQYRRRNQFREPPRRLSNSNHNSGTDWNSSTGFWGGDSGSSWSGGGDSSCSGGGDSGGSCSGDGGGGGGGD